jgi:methylenetetrahydrofolate reductase (NADPH)
MSASVTAVAPRLAAPARLAALAQSRHRPIVTAECPSADGGTVEDLAARLATIAPFVDAVNVTDNPAAHAHASNVSMAIALAQLGIEPIMQIVCRDKNRLAIQADIAGASMFGIVNFSALTGDDVTAGDEPEARRVFDLDGPQLVSVMSGMKAGTYLSGRSFSPAGEFFIGAVENPGAPPLDYRADRALLKVNAGAQMVQLQISYRPDQLEAFMAACVANGVAERAVVLPSVCLTKGARALSFMNDKVPGISVPADVIARVSSAADQSEEAYLLVRDLTAGALALPGVAGIHITDFRHDGSVQRLTEDLRIGPRFDTTSPLPHEPNRPDPSPELEEHHAHHA